MGLELVTSREQTQNLTSWVTPLKIFNFLFLKWLVMSYTICERIADNISFQYDMAHHKSVLIFYFYQ
jgi:hypothetical protein